MNFPFAKQPISGRRLKQLEDVDAMPRDLRECVHEFGFAIVYACRKYGIQDPAQIRDLVREIWAGARQTGQKNDARNVVDWILAQSGSSLSFVGLKRALKNNNLTICGLNPSAAMIDASLAEVSGHNIRCTKREKHQRRLQAALRVAMEDLVLERSV